MRPLRIKIDALVESIQTFDDPFDAIGQKKMAVNPIPASEGQKTDHWVQGGV